MVPLVARQSICIKCNMRSSALLGNYEFYYAAGLFCKIKGIAVSEDILPKELKELILPELEAFSGEDERERHLVKMLLNYLPSDGHDGQMKELLQWGLNEEKIWQATA